MSDDRELPDDDDVQEVGEILEELADSGGAAVDKLASEAGRPLLDHARTPLQWTRRQQAAAVHEQVKDLLEALQHDRHRHADRSASPGAGTADTLPSRLEEYVRRTGVPSQPRQNGKSSGVRPEQLAKMAIERLEQMNSRHAWNSQNDESASRREQLPDHPFEFDAYHMLFTFRGRAGFECTTYRWLRALRDGIDEYPTVGWYFSDPSSPVEIEAVANCRVTDLTRRPDGGVAGVLKLARPLRLGEVFFFASRIRYASTIDANRVITHEVRSKLVRRLTIGVQFDPAALPGLVWRFDSEDLNITPPVPGSDAFLSVSELGFVEHVFENCRHGRKVGLQWDWSHQPLPATPRAERSQQLTLPGEAQLPTQTHRHTEDVPSVPFSDMPERSGGGGDHG